MGNQVTKTADNVRKRMTIRRRRPDQVNEFTAEDIEKRFNNIPTLTDQEKIILKTSWAVIQHKVDETGTQLFIKMFEANPETQNVFTKFQGIDLVQLEASQEIVHHGRRVMRIVDMVITNLENYQEMWEQLIKLGRDHFSYGALPMYLDLMGPHFVIAVRQALENDWYEALEYHWLALFNIIVYVMKFGWHLQRADVQRKARSHSMAQ